MRRSLWMVLSACFVAIAAAAVAVARAQVAPRPVEPRIIAGDDIGFRVESIGRDRVVGHLVVRIDGAWVEVQAAGRMVQVR